MRRLIFVLALGLVLGACSSDSGTSDSGTASGTVGDAAGSGIVGDGTDAAGSPATGADTAETPGTGAPDPGGTTTVDPGGSTTTPDTGTPSTGTDDGVLPTADITLVEACNEVTNGNCAAGERCVYDQTGKKSCIAAGTAQQGEECGQEAMCLTGECYNIGGGFRCYRYCTASEDCDTGWGCKSFRNEANEIEPFMLCAPEQSCDVFAQDCEAPQGCYASSDSEPTCLSHNGVDEGAACEPVNDCKPGFTCGPAGCARHCRASEEAGENEKCPEGQACTRYTENHDFGVCVAQGGGQ